ncbi:MAG: GH25 family lysozyme [Methanosphaera sp.]|nr:GH25 family lysozyme [Methanosphaera sp.]
MKGIDISKHNGNYDLAQAKAEGYDFVIVRAGYTGWGDGVTKAKDLQFENNYNKAKELGMPVGAYYFTIATDYQKGVDEANWLYENCLKGKQFDYPIYIDVEDDTGNKKYLRKAGKAKATDGVIGFCETLENLGYYVGIYGSDISTFKDMLEIDRLKDYDKWVARYGSKPQYVKEYNMWQYSSSDIVAGQPTDTNLVENIDYPSIIISKGFNGYPKQETPVELPKPEPPKKKEIALGDTVIVNGIGTSSSTGEGTRTREFVNQKMKVIMIAGNTSRPNRYALNQYNKGNVNDPSAVTGWFSINNIKK